MERHRQCAPCHGCRRSLYRYFNYKTDTLILYPAQLSLGLVSRYWLNNPADGQVTQSLSKIQHLKIRDAYCSFDERPNLLKHNARFFTSLKSLVIATLQPKKSNVIDYRNALDALFKALAVEDSARSVPTVEITRNLWRSRIWSRRDKETLLIGFWLMEGLLGCSVRFRVRGWDLLLACDKFGDMP